MTTLALVIGTCPFRSRSPFAALVVADIWQVCHALLAWLVALNIADLITTHAVLAAGGRESNPIMEPVIDNVVAAGSVKGVCLALVIALAFRARRPDRLAISLGVVNLWYALVVGWNFAVLARA